MALTIEEMYQSVIAINPMMMIKRPGPIYEFNNAVAIWEIIDGASTSINYGTWTITTDSIEDTVDGTSLSILYTGTITGHGIHLKNGGYIKWTSMARTSCISGILSGMSRFIQLFGPSSYLDLDGVSLERFFFTEINGESTIKNCAVGADSASLQVTTDATSGGSIRFINVVFQALSPLNTLIVVMEQNDNTVSVHVEDSVFDASCDDPSSSDIYASGAVVLEMHGVSKNDANPWTYTFIDDAYVDWRENLVNFTERPDDGGTLAIKTLNHAQFDETLDLLTTPSFYEPQDLITVIGTEVVASASIPLTFTSTPPTGYSNLGYYVWNGTVVGVTDNVFSAYFASDVLLVYTMGMTPKEWAINYLRVEYPNLSVYDALKVPESPNLPFLAVQTATASPELIFYGSLLHDGHKGHEETVSLDVHVITRDGEYYNSGTTKYSGSQLLEYLLHDVQNSLMSSLLNSKPFWLHIATPLPATKGVEGDGDYIGTASIALLMDRDYAEMFL